MKLKVNFEWRQKEEPHLDAEFLVKTALKAAGYTVGHIQVQGVWDEDKPAIAQGPSYKQQASSCKRQAASLTRDLYSVTVSYKLKEKEYETI